MSSALQPSSYLGSSIPTHLTKNRCISCRPTKSTKCEARIADSPASSTSTSSSSSSAPPSWPSEAALRKAFGNTTPKQQQNLPVTVTGKLPEWLNGCYLRNGPGTYENGTPEGMVHMFDGYAQILKLQIDGKSSSVELSHEFVKSEAFKAFEKTGKMKWREFATPVPSEGIFSTAADIATMALGSMGIGQGVTDNASVNVLPAPYSDGNNKNKNKFWAVTETVAGTIEMDRSTLSTLGKVTYNDNLKGDLTTAHPTILPTGELINLLSAPGVGFTVYRQNLKTSSDSITSSTASSGSSQPVREKIATIPHKRPLSPAWIHDFPGSKKYIVIPESPLYFNLGALMLGSTTDHIFLDWVPEEGTRLHVVDVTNYDGTTKISGFGGGGAQIVKTFTAPPFFCFHWANAFESDDGRYLHLDGSIYNDPEIVNHLDMKNVTNAGGPSSGGQSLPPATLRRLTIDLQAPSGSAVPSAFEPLIEDEASYGNFVEFPCVNPKRKGENARYIFGTAAVRPTNVNNALAKFDLVEKKATLWHEAGGVVGEPLFIPAPANNKTSEQEEDDGVVIAVVAQPDGKSALIVLDGQSFKEVARAVLPYGITNGFHGAFIPE
jgi:carlactone synthase/all-trans-10'-apo-beta-carotenal 13,14-cleaving dioxygenase